MDFKFKRNEDVYLNDIYDYVRSTYGQHYAGNNDVQLVDYWKSMGILLPVSIGTAMKYLARFGKKQGYNRKDIYKAVHYALLALYALEQEENSLPNDSVDPGSDGLITIAPDAPELVSVIQAALRNRAASGADAE